MTNYELEERLAELTKRVDELTQIVVASLKDAKRSPLDGREVSAKLVDAGTISQMAKKPRGDELERRANGLAE